MAYKDTMEVRTVLSRFLTDLQNHLDKKEYKNFLFGKTALDEVGLRYKPHEYTKDNLVVPLLRSVHLDHQSEPQPQQEQVVREYRPDFEITNTTIPYIGEIKPANRYEEGIEEIRQYLSIDGFDTPFGILTDGVRWGIYGPSKQSTVVSPQCLREVSLLDAMKLVALSDELIEISALPSTTNRQGIDEIEQFEATFSRNRLDTWALSQLDREDRSTYSTDGRPLQASLDWDWK